MPFLLIVATIFYWLTRGLVTFEDYMKTVALQETAEITAIKLFQDVINSSTVADIKSLKLFFYKLK